jgi:NAD(P)-dependent dehydrogenase (short-subunit alcohol dehydrogenase family)
MAERRDGVIVNLSGAGIGGPQPPGNMSAYTTTKAALVVLTETLSEELAPVGIRVYAVAPGALSTELMRPVLDAGVEIAGARLHELSRRIYDPRGPAPSLLPSEFVDLLRFLVAERPAWLSGKLLSAKWDSLDSLRARQDELESTSLLTLRRIDGVLFEERPVKAPGRTETNSTHTGDG